MSISIFDLFSIGIGPSSSHTVGPMLAAYEFVENLSPSHFEETSRILTELYGSLALTGIGHGTDKAIINGLAGEKPDTVDPDSMIPRMLDIISSQSLLLAGKKQISFNRDTDLLLHQKEFLPKHSNGMKFSAFNAAGDLIHSQVIYSIGGGFIVNDEHYGKENTCHASTLPYLFESGRELELLCERENKTISEVMMENEKIWNDEPLIRKKILHIVNIMENCIQKGTKTEGILPGGLHVIRRAPLIHKKLQTNPGLHSVHEDADIMNRLNIFAMAVNEENAAGGRVVTAPTNGAAGIIPAVIAYYKQFHKDANEDGVINFMLTAAAIGILYKKNASISGAEVGCQGEVGVASSMAAAGLAAALGGTVSQIENAAEIAMEHHLGMTCDPIMGLVQIPCIERNAMGALKAVNAARLALIGDGTHIVHLDKVIATMRETGMNMMTIYKETSLGGLAVNVPEC